MQNGPYYKKSNNHHFFYCNKLHKSFVLLLRFYATTKDTEAASKNTVHFTAGNTKLQLPELPKVGDKTKPIRFFLLALPPIITSLCCVSLCCSHLISCLCLKSSLLFLSRPGEQLWWITQTRDVQPGLCARTAGCCQVPRPISGSALRTSRSRHADLPQIFVWMG